VMVMLVRGNSRIGRAGPRESPDVILLYFSFCDDMKEVVSKIKRVETWRTCRISNAATHM
jgi:hypothetical protein